MLFQNKEYIAIVPHYINSLRYFDKIYEDLLKNNIEIIYFFPENKRMENYCSKNDRSYIILDFEKLRRFRFLFRPLIHYRFKKNAERLIEKNKIRLILQNNDILPYNYLLVKAAKKKKVLTFILQWALTNPESIDLKNRELKRLKALSERPKYKIFFEIILELVLKVIHYPLNLFLSIHSDYKLSFAQGESDLVGVMNGFSKKILMKQGVIVEKIKVVGSLHYDDALKIKSQSNKQIRKNYNIRESEIVILFFSQPFYQKDLAILTLEEQLNYTEALINTVEDFYNDKLYELIIKLHPTEDFNDYKKFFNRKNLRFLSDADNNELILISNFCISQQSTVLQSVIVLNKPVMSLNILGLNLIEIGANVLGIKNCIKTWEEFNQTLELLHNTNYSPLNNVNYDRVIMDGKCYDRIITLIKDIINISQKNSKY